MAIMLAESPKKTGRPPNEDYMKLMRPDEDWRQVANGAERRKLQNRLAQRAYRRNLREKSKEVEKLKDKLRRFEKTKSHDRSSSSPEYTDTYSQEPISTENMEISTSEDKTTLSKDLLPLSDFEADTSYEYEETDFEPYHSNNSTSSRSAPQRSLSPHDPRRSSSPFTNPSPEPEICSYFPTSEYTLSPDFLFDAGGSGIDPSLEMIGMISGSLDGNFPISFTNPFQSSSHSNSQAHSQYPSSTDTTLCPTDTLSSTTNPLLDFPSSEDRWAPDSNASLLHFAVASGQLSTLNLILQHQRLDLNVQDAEGYTAIQRAIMLGRTDMVEVLLRASCRG